MCLLKQDKEAERLTVMHSDVLYVCCAEIREAFRVLDRDGNGFISKQELGMAMRSLGYMPSEVELAIIMQRLDMDGKMLHKDTLLGACMEQQTMHFHICKTQSATLHVRLFYIKYLCLYWNKKCCNVILLERSLSLCLNVLHF